jgi:hypothetical protein
LFEQSYKNVACRTLAVPQEQVANPVANPQFCCSILDETITQYLGLVGMGAIEHTIISSSNKVLDWWKLSFYPWRFQLWLPA